MISYSSKDWIQPIFRIHKSDTFRRLLPLLLFCAAFTAGIVYLERQHLSLSPDHFARHLGTMHTLLGFALSMLLVFRTNTAYDRWWEGRKLWGSLVNGSRNLSIKLQAFLPDGDAHSRRFFRQAIPLFATVLQRHLLKETTRLQLDKKPHPELPDFNSNTHVPNQVAASIFGKVQRLYRDGVLSGDALIVLNEELRSLTDICGACERIKNTPIPYSYSSFIKKFIFIYVITLPFGFAFTLSYLAVPVVAFIFYVLASLELIAEEIEDPFGHDSNDLPLERLCATIKANVEALLVNRESSIGNP